VIAALRYEWVRITTVRSTWIVLVLTLLGSGLLGYVAANPQHVTDETGNPVGDGIVDWYIAFSIPLSFAVILASVVAAQSIGQEYRFGLIRLTLTAFPARAQILAAKLVVVAGAAVVVALVSYAGSEIAVVLRGAPTPPDTSTLPDPSFLLTGDGTFFLRGVLFVVLWALSAFALAGVTRQTAIGIAVPIISGLVVEQILIALLGERWSWLTLHLPWSAGGRWASDQGASGQWTAIAVFAAWVVVFLAVETVAFLRRDA
jgi:ABC-2 type transport system permease protein